MPSLIYSEQALEDLRRLSAFLGQDDPAAAEATASLIMQALEILGTHPLIGRITEGELRELVISRGRSGYIALYEFEVAMDRIVIYGLCHQREAGFEE